MKDDSGNCAVCTEQSASATHMTAENFLDVISRIPARPGQATDDVSDQPQIEMRGAPELLDLSEEDCPKICLVLPTARTPQHWDSIDDPAVPLERNLYGHPVAGLLRERNKLRKFRLKKDGKMSPDASASTFIANCNYSGQCMLTT